MNRNLAHKLALLLMVAALVVALFACSPRDPEAPRPEDSILQGGGENNVVAPPRSTTVKADQLKTETLDALENYKAYYDAPEDPEWFIMDLTVTYAFEHFWLDSEEKYNKSSAFTIEVKGNLHLKDNNKSELFFQVRNANNMAVLAVYYASGYTYVCVGTQKYYMPELNFTEVGGALFGVLQSAGIDVNQILGGVLSGGETGVGVIDDLARLAGRRLFYIFG